ncbi:MAG TPA: twin-arginine translocase TatA/TatE family subunit [Armatimonadetes bacterium]|nr:twin-arginine translocase TatA/TatE family subunit [Armatimonadota bacterium]
MFGLGTPEIVAIIVLVLILFGGKKIPEIMRGLGEGMREFRKAQNSPQDMLTRMADGEPVAGEDADDLETESSVDGPEDEKRTMETTK